MDAISFLIKEHDKVRKILDDISDDTHRDTTKREMFVSLCNELIRHETMEETIWYPHFKDNENLEDIVKHLIHEEKTAEKTMKQFQNITDSDEWNKKFSDFKKDVLHHAKEEETKLFPKIKKILDEEELDAIGKSMREFKEKYQDSK